MFDVYDPRLSVMWYVLTVSQVGAMARFEWNLLSVNIHSKSYKVLLFAVAAWHAL